MEQIQEQQVIDLQIAPTKKRKIRINGDQTRILELDLSDMGIVGRLKTAYKDLQALSKKVAALGDDLDKETTEETLEVMDSKLKALDAEMRQKIDYLFNSNVSEVCLPDGTMYDPWEGEFMYEHIIESLAKLYENNLDAEFEKIKKRVDKHTRKYTAGR